MGVAVLYNNISCNEPRTAGTHPPPTPSPLPPLRPAKGNTPALAPRRNCEEVPGGHRGECLGGGQAQDDFGEQASQKQSRATAQIDRQSPRRRDQDRRGAAVEPGQTNRLPLAPQAEGRQDRPAHSGHQRPPPAAHRPPAAPQPPAGLLRLAGHPDQAAGAVPPQGVPPPRNAGLPQGRQPSPEVHARTAPLHAQSGGEG